MRSYQKNEINKALLPGGELPKEGQRHNRHILHAAVDSPDEFARGKKQRVSINITDTLEREYAYKRINLPDYMAGKLFRGDIDVNNDDQWNMERIDYSSSEETKILLFLHRARVNIKIKKTGSYAAGIYGAKILKLILLDDKSISEVAEIEGYDNPKGIYFIGETFRVSLTQLAKTYFSP